MSLVFVSTCDHMQCSHRSIDIFLFSMFHTGKIYRHGKSSFYIAVAPLSEIPTLLNVLEQREKIYIGTLVISHNNSIQT